ncbi:hypothetical protein FCULG_00002891 [Fusarium culmorum]|uniref:Uncharacterized protein n=1 Tax=Fusarium culmorum TaxID=5516 RepID=A0A2T4HAT1_FUSCU|nr:hypothetical protein FCULG_00002891 [Fusarium culmorum]
MATNFLTQDEAASAIVSFAFSGALGSPAGKGVGYALMGTTPDYFIWSAALEELEGPPVPIDRYLIKIDRRSKEISPPTPIVLSEQGLSEAIQSATGQHLSSWERLTDGALSISYKVTVKESADSIYIVQLRHHGNVASMDSLMSYITRTVDPTLLPVPPVYPIPHEKQRQEKNGMGRQITQLIPGVMCSSVYPNLSHEQKISLLPKAARAFQACWDIPLPEPRIIGEVVADLVNGEPNLRIDPDRHHSLGGPFASGREYLCAYINSSLIALEKQKGIDEYKTLYLARIRGIVSNSLHNIPHIVEQTPVVLTHSDMGPHNIVVSSENNSDIKAIIDWEFIASAPFGSLHHILEMFFRKDAPSGFGQEYDRSDELRQAFWDVIPKWKLVYESEPTQVFLEWMKFGLFLKPEWRPNNLPASEAERYWQENVRVVETMLQKYG